ncbi:MAG: calcium-binding protein [Porphyrobacter sp.]|nr:calcium-binding protein [Porphyrobacter sp.]
MHRVSVGLALLVFSATALAQGGPPPGGGGRGPGGPGEGGPGMRRMPEMKPLKREKFDKAVTALFEAGDVNRDGYVTLAELRGIQTARREEVITERFKRIDSDHNGSISATEFSIWQQQLGSVVLSEEGPPTLDLEIIPDVIRPKLGDDDMALERLIDPLSATVIAKANVNYDSGVTLAEMLAYQGARFEAADEDRDGTISMEELRFVAPDRAPGPRRPGGGPGEPPSGL